MGLKGKVAIVTGAGRGLGKASSIEMAKEGASLVILSRTPSELRETAKAIKSLGGNVISIKADVSEPKDIDKVVDRTIEQFGKIDILMNNAGIVGPVSPIFMVDEEDWNEVMNINLRGPYLFSKAVAPYMLKQGRGKIINVTSGLGEIVMPFFGAYSVAKAGLIHLTKIMSEELECYNIQVNGLDPGVMDTRMQEEIRNLGPEILGDEICHEFMSMKERGVLKPPEKVAKLAVFLASGESDSITGENGTENFYTRLGYRKVKKTRR
jgi:NAD(P)-dependent dehydrogenase (short-subunit alcohol dehydrogenase family)